MSTKSLSSVSRSDMFLHVETKRAGKIKGESITEFHVDDIEVRSLTWGVAASSALGSGKATARRQYKHLVVHKGIDSASTPLLAALATNDEVKQATLTMRKAGGDPIGYYVIKLRNARVVTVDINVDEGGLPVESVGFSYTGIDIEYHRQQGSGGSAGATSFTDDVLESA